MAVHCDGCDAILKVHMGAAALRLIGPKPTREHFLQAAAAQIELADLGVSEDIELDFCATCINKMFAIVGMDLRLAAAFVMPAPATERSSALTDEEREELGLVDVTNSEDDGRPWRSPCCQQELQGGSDAGDYVLRCVRCHEIVWRKPIHGKET